jgi:ABC-type Mn2+/Zn2+ transport system ATPase subunit
MGRYARAGWWRRYSRDDEKAVDGAIKAMHLEELEHRQVSALSGGQQQRTFLARALAQEAHVFLLDEPFTGLDKPTQDNLKTLLRELRDAGKLIVASHHDLSNVREIFDQVLFLNGELLAVGPVADVFTEEHIERTYNTPIFSGPAHVHAHHDHDHA